MPLSMSRPIRRAYGRRHVTVRLEAPGTSR